MNEASLEKRLERMDNKLSNVLKELKKPTEEKTTWVKASVITELTGWDKEKFRRMRNNGSIIQKRDEKGIWYSLESLHTVYYKKHTNA